MKSQSTNRTQEQLKNLFEYYRSGKLYDAEKLARTITRENPLNEVAWKALWGILQKTGKTKESLTAIQKAAQISPRDAKVCYSLGYTLLKLGNLGKAEATFRNAVALKDDYAEAYHYLGVTIQKLGKLEEAEIAYIKAIALKPNYGKAHFNLGNAMKKLGKLEKAEKSYRQAIGFNPNFYLAHYNLAAILYKQEKLNEAEACYRKVIALKPGLAEAYSDLGVTLQELGRLDEAAASYKQAIALKPDNAEAHFNFGVTLKRMGRLEDSEKSYKQAIVLKPVYAEVQYNLGATLQRMHRLDEAAASYKQAIALKPDYSFAKHKLAALTGETTETAPRDYVEELFDTYAAKFESHLVDNLEYRVPRVLTDIIIRDSKSDLLGSISDLGCGTGLFGLEINKFCEHLEGVDLSEKMLEKAKEKNVYNKLVKQDIIEYLSTTNLNFDYFVSTEVFIYIGDLSDVFRLIKSRNEIGGKLAFSTEHYDGDGFFLEQSGRYSHSKAYIDSLCETFGYKVCHFETQNLRKTKSQYLEGGLYILDF